MDSEPGYSYLYGHHSLLYGHEDDTSEELHEESKEFYTLVRTLVIYITSVILLYILSNYLISYFSKHRDDFRLDIEEYKTYKISTWICAFTLAIAIAAFLLLPVSIITNEFEWIDDAKTKSSLLHRVWSYVFLSSNLSLFIMIPFAWFFTESEGFSGSKRGLLSRLRETLVLLILVAIIVLGLTYTICCLFFGIGCHVTGFQLITNFWQYLPFLYSCISFIGALLLLLCTPLGISHLSTVLDQMKSIQKTRNLYLPAKISLRTLATLSMILVFYNMIKFLYNQFINSESQLTELESSSHVQTKNGPIYAFLDIVMIIYLWCASMCGLYNLPGLCCLRPRKNNSSFNQIIGNCTILCLLSSALPLLAKTLGMTNFDLLADFGRIEWLGNVYVVLLYNLVFLISTTLCLMDKRELVITINIFKSIIGDERA